MKYIPVDKLIAKLRQQKRELELSIQSQGDYGQSCQIVAYENILSLITSLQREQTEVQNGKFVFPKYLYARTKDNKTIDMSYAPQDMTAVEYVRNDFVEQEQPEVDLEKEIDKEWAKCEPVDEGMGLESANIVNEQFDSIARHFAEWGAIHLSAKKEE